MNNLNEVQQDKNTRNYFKEGFIKIASNPYYLSMVGMVLATGGLLGLDVMFEEDQDRSEFGEFLPGAAIIGGIGVTTFLAGATFNGMGMVLDKRTRELDMRITELEKL